MSIKTLVYCALYGAIAFIATSFLQIRITFGYIHLGDIIFFILLRSTFQKQKSLIYCLLTYVFFMGISDIYLGYPNYVLTTIITRLLLILIYYSTYKISIIRSFSWFFIPINYFFTDTLLFGKSLAISFLLFNFLQIIFPFFLQIIPWVYYIFKKIHLDLKENNILYKIKKLRF